QAAQTRSAHSRYHVARQKRIRFVPRNPRREKSGPEPDAFGERTGDRQGGRPRARRGRLRDEAVQFARVVGASAGPPPPRRSWRRRGQRSANGDRVRKSANRLQSPSREARQGTDRTNPARIESPVRPLPRTRQRRFPRVPPQRSLGGGV